jgi:hypothetical protein
MWRRVRGVGNGTQRRDGESLCAGLWFYLVHRDMDRQEGSRRGTEGVGGYDVSQRSERLRDVRAAARGLWTRALGTFDAQLIGLPFVGGAKGSLDLGDAGEMVCLSLELLMLSLLLLLLFLLLSTM